MTFDATVCVWVRPEVQLERTMARDGCSAEEAERRIALWHLERHFRYEKIIVVVAEYLDTQRDADARSVDGCAARKLRCWRAGSAAGGAV